jgi:hypothetical protein
VLTPEEGKALVGNIANFAVQQKLAPKLAPDAAPETPIFDISKLDPKWNRIPKTAQVAIQKAPPQVQQSVVDILHQAGDITETWELNDLLVKINQLSLGQEARDSLSLAVDTDFKTKMDAKDAEKKKQQSLEKQTIRGLSIRTLILSAKCIRRTRAAVRYLSSLSHNRNPLWAPGPRSRPVMT